MFRQKTIRSIASSVLVLSSVIRRLRPKVWSWWYNVLARRDKQGELLFMNYGYRDSSSDRLDLVPDDEKYRLPIQLYEHVISQLDLSGKELLEVGCGRGGGLDYIASYKNILQVTGVDISKNAIDWCREHHHSENGLFEVGSADALPLDDNSIDVIINVESSHCYPSMKDFLSEVRRVLKPGAYFSLCDMRTPKGLLELDLALQNSGLEHVADNDITDNVVAALEQISDTRQKDILNKVPLAFQKLFGEFAALKGSKIYLKMQSRELVYVSRVYKKTS